MKAAVLHQFGETPKYETFADPAPGEGQVLITVEAVALENVDKAMAAGEHFASRQFLGTLPAIVGFDGIGRLPDGRRVGFGGVQAPYGAMAEFTRVPAAYTVPVPEGVEAVTAAALPAAALTGFFPLKWGAKLQAGETVLINGATGVAGQLAVQIAKRLGAGRVVGTGRNPASLARVRAYGADAVIDLRLPADELAAAFKREAGAGYDVILDFLWGPPTETLIGTLVPEAIKLGQRVRLVQIGDRAGGAITLKAEALRTTGLEIIGGAAGLTPAAIGEGTAQIWEWLRTDPLQMEIERVPLADIEAAWRRTDLQGKRLVVVM